MNFFKTYIFWILALCVIVVWGVFLVYTSSKERRHDYFDYIPYNTQVYMNVNLKSLNKNKKLEQFVYSVLVRNFKFNDLIQAQHLLTQLHNEVVIAQYPVDDKLETVMVSRFSNQEEMINFLHVLGGDFHYSIKENILILSTDNEYDNSFNTSIDLELEKELVPYAVKDIYFYIDKTFLHKIGYPVPESVIGGMYLQHTGNLALDLGVFGGSHIPFVMSATDIKISQDTMLSYYVTADVLDARYVYALDPIGLRGVISLFEKQMNDVKVSFGFLDNKYVFDILFDIAGEDAQGLITELLNKIRDNVAVSFPRSYKNTLPDGTNFDELFIDPGSVMVNSLSDHSFTVNVEDKAYKLFVDIFENTIHISNMNDFVLENPGASITSVAQLQSRCLYNDPVKQKNVFPYIYVKPTFFGTKNIDNLVIHFLQEFDTILLISQESGLKACLY